ncbi:TetR/AcrR family transcriptional regulator [Aureimonas jatrophae]|uniref:Transcriptional regulator, TetR family n=1 Tax=Aureimonas jatrophae TaxID=1166073 RepID=A0A1H0MJ04_9HYPH|nr:TetR/AcrR family transcriptional regulator [Aureimonas jatrophae]MBB3952936.1 TetR/AcrR family transcriptional repressor of nem operon [Aureimonas jatrophae]SDO80392.1 transcriptional regulator, TetR family [Aureimonas jatrophae]
MGSNVREDILGAARRAAQAHGYTGLNFRELAAEVGIKSASIHYHFPTKVDLGAAVAKRYWEDSEAVLGDLWNGGVDPVAALHAYPDTFRRSLENGNRICLCSFMSAEHDDLPDPVKAEVSRFAEINVAWLAKVLGAATDRNAADCEPRARAIFAAVAGAQLMARSRADVAAFDALIDGYRDAGLLPA